MEGHKMLDYQLLCNQRINENPLVLFNTIFKVVEHETDIRGYWLDKSKLYIDNIELLQYSIIDNMFFINRIHLMFSQGEQAVFYKDFYNIGNVRYKSGKWKILKNRIEIIENQNPSNNYIKLLLKNNSGLTIYKIDNGQYLIEIYK